MGQGPYLLYTRPNGKVVSHETYIPKIYRKPDTYNKLLVPIELQRDISIINYVKLSRDAHIRKIINI